jgi:AraC family transcriptional regulator
LILEPERRTLATKARRYHQLQTANPVSEGTMALLVHNQKYEASPQLHASLDWPDLRVAHLRLEPRGLRPVTFTCNEIAVVLAGRTITTRTGNGVTQRDVIQPGVACLNPIGTYESQADIASPIEDIHIFIPPTLIGQSALADYNINPAKAELAYAGGLRDPLIYQIALAFHDIISRPPESTDRLFIDGMQSVLAAHLFAHYAIDRWRPPSTKPDIPYPKLKRVIDLIEARFAEAITLRELAAEACLSPFHFSRLFRQATGLSPHRYVTERRVQEAQRKLASGNSSLVEIALETGFGSQANFIRTFRKSTGLTPGQFRALHRR